VDGIRHVVKLRENVMMNENKTRMKCLSAGRNYDRKKKRKRNSSSSIISYCDPPFLFKDVIVSPDVIVSQDVSYREIVSKKNINGIDLLFFHTYHAYHSR
jgi:hypothetical protein